MLKDHKLALFIATVLPACVFIGHAQEQRKSAESQKPIVVTVHRTHGKLQISVEPNSAPNGDTLDAFGRLLDERGRDYPIIALVDSDSMLSDIFQPSMFAGKVGFLNIHVFLVNRRSGFMSEIKLGASIPVSLNPPFDSRPFNSQ